jgi:hypothetical protein
LTLPCSIRPLIKRAKKERFEFDISEATLPRHILCAEKAERLIPADIFLHERRDEPTLAGGGNWIIKIGHGRTSADGEVTEQHHGESAG